MYSKIRLIRWNVRLLILVMLFIFLLVPSVTFAYNLSGYTWLDVDPLYYDIDWCGWRTRNAWSQSIGDWNLTSTPVNFENYWYFKVGCFESRRSDVTWDGYCWRNTYENYIMSATCTLNAYYTDGYSASKRKSVSGHELGHVLGLSHMPWYYSALMNGYTYWRYDVYGVNTPQQDDINGVNAMYE